MQALAIIPSKTILISGQPNSGWSGCDEGTPGSFELEFSLRITSDGGKGGPNRNVVNSWPAIKRVAD